MSTCGARKNKNKRARKLFDRPQITNASQAIVSSSIKLPTIQHMSLEQALANPQQSGLPPQVGAIFGQMKELEARTMQFISAAKMLDKQERAQSVHSFMVDNEAFIQAKLESLINTIRIYLLQKHEIPYALMNQRLQQIQAGQIESNPEKQSELFDKKIKESEYLFLLGYEKINICQTVISLLEKYDPENQNLRKQSIMHMFEDLTQSTSFLINRFILCKLKTVDYYHCQIYLQEKASWLLSYGEEYQRYLHAMPCETQSEKKLAWMRTCDLLQCYQSVVSFLYSSQHIEKAKTIHLMAKTFLANSYAERERFISENLLIGVIDALYQGHQDKYEHMTQIADSSLQDAWLPFLGTLTFFYEKDWSSCAVANLGVVNVEDFDVERLCQEVTECKDSLSAIAQSDVTLLTMQFRSALAFLSQYKSLPNELKTKPVVQAHFNLSIELFKIVSARTANNVFYHQTILAIFKLLANEVSEDLKKLIVVPKKIEAPQRKESLASSQAKVISLSPALMGEMEEDPDFNAFIDTIADQFGGLIISDSPGVSDSRETEVLGEKVLGDEIQEKKLDQGTQAKPIPLAQAEDLFQESQSIVVEQSTLLLTENHERIVADYRQKGFAQEETLFRESQDAVLEQHTASVQLRQESDLKDAEEMHRQAMESLRAEYAEKLQAETTKMEALFQEKKAQMSKAQQEEKTQLSLSLNEDYQKQIQQLSAKHTLALETERSSHKKNLAKFKARKQRQYDKKIQALQQNNDAEINLLKQTQSQVITHIQEQHLKRMSAQETSLALELKKTTQSLNSEQQSAAEKLKSAHEKKLKEMMAEHDLNIQALKENNQRTLKAHQEKFALQLQEKTRLVDQEYTVELSKLQTIHESNILELIAKHEQAMRELESSHSIILKQAILDEVAQHQIQASSLLSSQSALYSAREQELSTPKPHATDGLTPFARIILPPETLFILKELKSTGIEYYFGGGFVRNRLLGMPLSPHEDIDIIVNCKPGDLPPSIKSGFMQELVEPRKFKLGKIDLWCEPWDKLADKLKQRDLSINGFICKDDGSVYDLLDKKQDLYSPYLHMLGNTEERFDDDSSLMLRLIRFSGQVGKAISPSDWDLVLKHAEEIKNLDIGIYLKNIERVFVSSCANQNLDLILKGQLLTQVCPLLTMTDTLVLYKNPMLLSFVRQKLYEFSQAPENYSYYHVLALFAIIPMLQFAPEVSPQERLQYCFDNFFATYTGSCDLAERNKIQKIVASLMFDVEDEYQPHNYRHLGMLSQHNQYAQHYYQSHKRQTRTPQVAKKVNSSSPQSANSTSANKTREKVEDLALEAWPRLTPLSQHIATTSRQNKQKKKPSARTDGVVTTTQEQPQKGKDSQKKDSFTA